MNLRDAVTDAGARALNLSHRAVLTLSGGHLLSSAFGMPAVELAVTGRKSGLRRTTLLTAPICDDRRVVLVASKGGDHRDPEWFRNLVVKPDVEVKVLPTGQTRRLRARVASAEERADVWPRILAAYRGYGVYQERTRRQIPVVFCEPCPVPPAASGPGS
jgi:deazaflavin-dependent oxidoreductase (nitroreductase family)